MKSRTITKTNSGLILLNQSIIDLIISLLVILQLITASYITDIGWFGIWGQIVCYLWINESIFSGSVLVSSLNLMILAVERALAIKWPLFHRHHAGPRNIIFVCLLTWTIGIGCYLTFMIPTTKLVGVQGHCVDFNAFPSEAFEHVFAFTMIFQIFFPLFIILSSTILIINSIKRSPIRKDSLKENKKDKSCLKRNVVTTLITVIMCYLICVIPRATVIVMYETVGGENIPPILPKISLAFMATNSALNPLIYTFQFRDFQKELRKSLHCYGDSVYPNTTTLTVQSVTNSHISKEMKSTILL